MSPEWGRVSQAEIDAAIATELAARVAADAAEVTARNAAIGVHAADIDAHQSEKFLTLCTGRYHNPLLGAGIDTQTITANQLYGVNLWIPTTMTFDQVACEVTTGVAGAARLGLYADGANLYPGALLKDFGTIDVTAAGVKEIVITGNLQLTMGLYWLALVSNVGPTFRKAAAHGSIFPLGMPTNNLSVMESTWKVAFTYAALPNPFTAGGAGFGQGGGIVIALRLLSIP